MWGSAVYVMDDTFGKYAFLIIMIIIMSIMHQLRT